MKEDEKKLLETLQARTAPWYAGTQDMPHVRQLIVDLNMNEKRAAYILEKWCGKGIYEYGVSVMAGWLTRKGLHVHV